MKIPVLLELLLVCVLIAFAASKSVDRLARDDPLPETTTFKANISSSGENSVRQDEISQEQIQIVQDLTDSQEAVISSGASEQVDAVVNPTTDIIKPASVENNEIDTKPSGEKPVNENDPNPINKFCSCSSASCKCCRDFSIPLIPIRGPGCATIRYLDNDRLSIGIKYGDLVLASRTVDSRRPTPICLPLPGGYNRFCGRVYGISREEENFKACLGLELRADDDVEASLRVSCFQFGPRGLATMEAEPLPPNITDDDEDEDDDDDDDDDDDPLGFGELAGGGDDDDDDDEDSEEAPGPGGIVGDVLGGILGGGAGGDDDDDDFGLTRFLGNTANFVSDFLGVSPSSKKKKPNEDIKIDRKNDEKTKKKTDFEKKTPKNSASKLKAETDDNDDVSVLETIEDTIEELTSDEDQPTTSEGTTETVEIVEGEGEGEVEKEETITDENDKDYDNEDDDDYQEDYNEVKTEENKVKPTEAKPKKKKKAPSSYGFGFLGRFFKFFA